jgi:hypothetical protein
MIFLLSTLVFEGDVPAKKEEKMVILKQTSECSPTVNVN